MIELDLDAIKARCEAATPGPWRGGPPHGAYIEADVEGGRPSGEYIGSFRPSVRNKPPEQQCRLNAIFAAHARSDVPALVAEVEQWRERAEVAKAAFQVQTAEVARLRGVIAGLMKDHPVVGRSFRVDL